MRRRRRSGWGDVLGDVLALTVAFAWVGVMASVPWVILAVVLHLLGAF